MPDIIDTAIGATSSIPGIGSAVSTGLGIGKGVFDLIKSNREQKKAQGLRPPMEDPEIRLHLQYLQRKQKAIENGSVYGRQSAEIGSELANTDAGIVEASGGNAGAAILGMTKAGRGAGEAYGNLVAKNAPLAGEYENDISKTLQDIADRKLNLQNMDHEQALGESAILKKSGEEAIMGGIARAVPMIFPKRTPTVASSPGIPQSTGTVEFNPAYTSIPPARSEGLNATPYAEQTGTGLPVDQGDMNNPNILLSRNRGLPYYNPLDLDYSSSQYIRR